MTLLNPAKNQRIELFFNIITLTILSEAHSFIVIFMKNIFDKSSLTIRRPDTYLSKSDGEGWCCLSHLCFPGLYSGCGELLEDLSCLSGFYYNSKAITEFPRWSHCFPRSPLMKTKFS